MATYLGYIVGKNETNPISVFIPARSGIQSFKMSEGFGTNAGKWDLSVLSKMIAAADKCYMSAGLSPNNGNYFDEVNGYTTLEDNQRHLNANNAKDVTDGKTARNTTSGPTDNFYLQSPFFSPAANLCRNYVPSSVYGMNMNSFTNLPGGTYSTLRIGSRVMVEFPDNGGTGYITSQLPGSDDFSAAITNLLG
jgi:hypothetical protein